MPGSPTDTGRATPATLLLGALGGVSAWLSLGTVAVLERESLDRVAALPPWWALAALVAAGALVAWAGRFRTTDLLPLGLTVLLWLPYLPMPVPAAFLLWTGPILPGVWAAALAGVVVARWPRWPGTVAAWSAHPRAPVAATAVAACLYVGMAAAVAPRVPTGDEPHYLVITQSLLRDGDLRIENNHLRGDYLEYYGGGQLRPDYLRRGADREIYSVHPPGVSVLALPAFALAGYAGVVVWLAVLAAIGGWLGWQAAHRLTGDRSAAWFAWAVVMLTTPMVFHAFTVYPDGPGAVVVAGVVLALVHIETRGVTALSPRALAGVGAALACLPWLHTRFSLLAAALGVVLVLRLWPAPDRWMRALALLAVPLVVAAAWFGYFWVIYGTPNPAAPYGGYTQSSLWYALTGVPGLLVDQQFGLLAYAPVYVAALAGVVPLGRVRPRLAVECIAVLMPYWLAVGSYAMWWGGFSAPARFLVASLPLLVLPAACAWHAWRGLATRTAMLVGLALSGLVVLVIGGVDRGALLYEGRTGYAELLDWANRTVNLPLALPAIHRGPVGTAVASTLVWAACLGAALVALSMTARRRRRWERGAWWLTAGLAFAGAVMAATTIAWRLETAPAVNRATSQLAFLSAWDPRRLEVGIELPALRWLDADRLPEQLRLSTTLRAMGGTGDAPLVAIPRVPAGEYDLITASEGGLRGQLTVRVGRDEHVIERWGLAGQGPDTGLRLTLPVEVHSVTIRGDTAAEASVGALFLRPRSVLAGQSRREYARRAVRVGRARAFFLDETAFVEEGGFWTQGEAATAVVLVPDGAARPAVRLQAGPVPVPVELRVDAWRWRAVIEPRASEVVSLPSVTAGEAVRVTIVAEQGFLPYEHDARSDDDRHLGVWVSVP